jgi:hypothetical protein
MSVSRRFVDSSMLERVRHAGLTPAPAAGGATAGLAGRQLRLAGRRDILLSAIVALALLALALASASTYPTGLERQGAFPQSTLAHQSGSAAALSQTARQRALDAYGKLPLSFVPNAGQSDPSVRYSAQAAGLGVYFTNDKAVLAFTRGERGAALDLRFLGASPGARLEARRPAQGKVSYLTNHSQAGQLSGLPTYNEVVYRGLWPGIDMVFQGTGGALKYKFVVHPGANVNDIRLGWGGTKGLSLGDSGRLLIQTPLGVLGDAAPRSFQRIGGHAVPVTSSFALERGTGGSGVYGFHVSGHDPRYPLVIDPSLAYSTFLGGQFTDQGRGITVDGLGNAYVTGFTSSDDFPTTAGAFDVTRDSGGDVFVTKLNSAGSGLVYSTYIGGGGTDSPRDIAIDALGNAYVDGVTASTNFPTTPGAFDTTDNPMDDGFALKLNATGSALAYSTYLGGSSGDSANGIALDSLGDAYVSGSTFSSDFPTTGGAADTSFNGGVGDAFVTKLDTTGAALDYSTYLGGSSADSGAGIALDGTGNAYVTGSTSSSDFPTTLGALDTSQNGSNDAFVTKLNPTGSSSVYSTFLGGSSGDSGSGIAVDAAGEAHLTGSTGSSNYPTTAGAFDVSYNGGGDAFVTDVNALGAGLVYSTFLGGTSADAGNDVALDAQDDAYIVGDTSSTNFPTTSGAPDTSYNGGGDAFVTKLNPTGSSPATYSTFLGGSSGENGLAIAVDVNGNAYATGITSSTNFPTTAAAYDTSFNGGVSDAFVTKITEVSPPATLVLSPPTATNPVDTQHCVTATVKDATGMPSPNVIVRFSVTGTPAGNTASGSVTTDANGEATFCYIGPALGPSVDAITAFADTDGNGSQDAGEPGGAAEKTWVPPTSTPLCVAKITDGGWITAQNGDKATFGGNASVDASGGTSGEETYQDHGPVQPMDVKSIDVTAVTCNQSRTQASIFGDATIDGSGNFLFRIDVKDLGEPGNGVDTYRIRLSNGYDSGERTLQGGNVQIHG